MTLMVFINGINDKNKVYSQGDRGCLADWYLRIYVKTFWIEAYPNIYVSLFFIQLQIKWLLRVQSYEKEFKLPNKTLDLFGSQKENQ